MVGPPLPFPFRKFADDFGEAGQGGFTGKRGSRIVADKMSQVLGQPGIIGIAKHMSDGLANFWSGVRQLTDNGCPETLIGASDAVQGGDQRITSDMVGFSQISEERKYGSGLCEVAERSGGLETD